MHVDHIIFASGPQGINADAAHLAERLGTSFREGGFHPRFGTRNHIIPLADARYLEVVEVLADGDGGDVGDAGELGDGDATGADDGLEKGELASTHGVHAPFLAHEALMRRRPKR